MMLQRQGNTVTSAIALISSSIILGCARPEIPQASTLPPTNSEQTTTQPVAQNTSSNDAVNRLLSTRECPGCDLQGAKLERADLSGVNLSNANLTGADLEKANLSNANLSGANLTNADLEEANLTGANLKGANFQRADLEDANLTNADVTGANFQGADLYGVIGLKR
ncbi:pentapeptide repeat-containing protein [Fischerella thermalis]|uniref:pentapeptide repeat-containing protein n=1 Tax=Fischerella thermalis TaxID=372787 RepID=UPI002155C9B3|nr:pentapeptide repeat-containing protein [Fischerella thermalis]